MDLSNLFPSIYLVRYIAENRYGDEFVKEVEVESREKALDMANMLENCGFECVSASEDGEVIFQDGHEIGEREDW